MSHRFLLMQLSRAVLRSKKLAYLPSIVTTIPVSEWQGVPRVLSSLLHNALGHYRQPNLCRALAVDTTSSLLVAPHSIKVRLLAF